MADLTLKQQLFCDKYLEHGNASKAYKEAGFKFKNDRVAEANSSRLMRNDKVRAYIQEERERLRASGKVARDDLLAKNAEIAFSNIDEVIKVEGGRIVLKDDVKSLNMFDGVSATYTLTESSSEKSDSKGGSGSSTSTSETKSFNLKRPDRLKALDQLARLLGEYDPDERDSGRNLKDSAERILSALAKVRPK